MRYFIVESVTLLLALVLILKFGLSWQLLPLLLLTWLMVVITFIDSAHLLIPDQLNYGLLWLGLLFSTTSLWPYTTPTSAIIGAVVAYLFLATIAWSFKWLMKKEGMGQGDFKLIAALTAWSGWQLLLPIILISGIMALLYAVAVIAIRRKNQPIPFAPFLCAATFIALLYQQPLLQFYFHSPLL
ncbi:MAG: prepilin peptidase [Gammaproteobacteria bacterium]|nr:prepilin peptidase [Gammaproteobacteria bacterium]